jgi:molybdopterin-guanine dinucleotide biosynthesis protein A
MEWSAGILAGGRSIRFGREKALVPWRGKPLLRHVLDRIGRPAYISANDPKYDEFGTRVPDVRGEACPLTGIYSLLLAVPEDRLFICGCDMPFVSLPLVEHLLTFEGDFILPVSPDGDQPLHAIYTRACLAPIRDCLDAGRLSVPSFSGAVKTVRVPVDPGEWDDPFLNVNLPEDLPS